MGAAWGAPIARVEVRVDQGPWQAATLLANAQASPFTWTFWTYDWGRPPPASTRSRRARSPPMARCSRRRTIRCWPAKRRTGRATARSPAASASRNGPGGSGRPLPTRAQTRPSHGRPTPAALALANTTLCATRLDKPPFAPACPNSVVLNVVSHATSPTRPGHPRFATRGPPGRGPGADVNGWDDAAPGRASPVPHPVGGAGRPASPPPAAGASSGAVPPTAPAPARSLAPVPAGDPAPGSRPQRRQ